MKIIRLTESELKNYIVKVINEQTSNINPKNLKFGDRGDDVKTLQQLLMDKGYLKTTSMKPTGYFGNLTNAALSAALGQKTTQPTQKTKPTSGQKTTQPQKGSFCQVITDKSEIKDLPQIISIYRRWFVGNNGYDVLNNVLNTIAKSYASQGIPQRTSCEAALIQVRPGYTTKNAIIVDTLNKLLYVFAKDGKFVAKTEIISGKNKQSVDPKVVARSLMTWDEQANSLGFKWISGKGYTDTTGKNRKYDDELIYSDTVNGKTAFLPKGIYTTDDHTGNASDYAGKKNNMLTILNGDKNLAQAIHGYYIEQPRTQALQKAEQVLSNPNDPKVGQEFMDLVSSKRVNLSQSYGCINVPENFLPILNKYMVNSYVFNMGEDKQNYLVNNTTNYFDKMQNMESCPSPKSLGAVPVDTMA